MSEIKFNDLIHQGKDKVTVRTKQNYPLMSERRQEFGKIMTQITYNYHLMYYTRYGHLMLC